MKLLYRIPAIRRFFPKNETELPERGALTARIARPGLFFLLLSLLVLHAVYYLPFFSDDAYISLRYAKRLVQGLGLTWTGGEVVEGYSDLLWVLLNAGL